MNVNDVVEVTTLLTARMKEPPTMPPVVNSLIKPHHSQLDNRLSWNHRPYRDLCLAPFREVTKQLVFLQWMPSNQRLDRCLSAFSLLTEKKPFLLSSATFDSIYPLHQRSIFYPWFLEEGKRRRRARLLPFPS